MAESIASRVDGPYAIYGHSMGARLAFEAVRELTRLGAPRPLRLYAGAAHPPHLPEPLARLARVTEDEFIEQLIARAGAPTALRDDPDIRTALMPAIRTDLAWLKRYKYQHDSPLEMPVVAFAGSHDREVAAGAMLGWCRHTSAWFRMHTIPGDHMFLRSESGTVTRLIASDLTAALAGDRHEPLQKPDSDEIHVFRALLDRMPDACSATDELSPHEAKTAAAFRRDSDRRRYTGRCVTLRRLLRRYGVDLGTREIPTGRYGKPHLGELAELRFSVSHSQGIALLAFSRGFEIGVDVERMQPMSHFDAFCDGALTPAERAELAAEPEETQMFTGLRFWTAKEAVLKATGDGLRVEPTRFGFAGQSREGPWRPDPDPQIARLAEWQIRHLELDGAVAAIAARHDDWRVRFETMPSHAVSEGTR